MKVLILNRRDIQNPMGGGAEVYTHEMAKGLVELGNEVHFFTRYYEGAPGEETIDGVRHIRKGGEFSVHVHGFLYAWKHRSQYDLIIDTYNGLGFFGFLLPRSIILIFQMYKEFWFRELGPVGFIPYLIEPFLLKRYRKLPAITISDSTVRDLEALGFRDISVVLVAINNPPAESLPEKDGPPTFMFLGRLRSTKRPEDAIRIFRIVKREVPDARLWMLGRGPEEERLKQESADMEDIVFHGWVDEERKLELLRQSHVLLVPGVREGYGINVIEASSQGTPSVGYDVHGLRDSIRDGRTGLLASGPEDAAQKAIMLIRDKELFRRLAEAGIEFSREFTWETRAKEFLDVLHARYGAGKS